LLYAVLFVNTAFTQSKTISGIVQSAITKKSIVGANVCIRSKENLVTHFAFTNKKGEFFIQVIDTLGSKNYFLEITVVGFEKKIIPLQSFRNNLILLDEAITILDTVSVKTVIPIKKRGDTLSYLVSAFEREEDRTIGDVIKRLPGISVNENGQISYNGKTISNLYIQGDDLMDGRYGLATKSINKNMIKSIDVLQNFQPIKVLQNKVWTDDVAINLTLKNDNSIKAAGQVIAGLGMPNLYDADGTVMLFNKKIKFLNSLKLNNRGEDYRNEFKQYTQETQLKSIDNNRPSKLLSLATVDNPDINENLYYNNNSVMLNLNNLYNTKDTVQYKTNIQIFSDRNALSFSNSINNFIDGNNIIFNQQQQTQNNNVAANISFTTHINKYTKYINNKLSILVERENNNARLQFNANSFTQNIKNNIRDFSNEFNWLPILKNNDILSIKWNINYYNIQQQLLVNIPIDSVTLNNGKDYLSVNQQLQLPTFFSNINASYIVSKKKWITQVYDIGLITESQKNISSILLTQLNSVQSVYTGDVGNNLNWFRNKWFISATYSTENKFLKTNLILPLFFQNITIKQLDYFLNEQNNRVFLNPKFNAQIFIGDEDILNISLSYNNNFSNINSVFRGLILKDYRTLQTNANTIQETYNTGSGLVYNFRRAISLLFINAGIRYNKIAANTISNTLLNNNIQQTQTINFNNQINTVTANVEISKYFFKLKTKVVAQAFWSRLYYNQLININIFKFANDAYLFSLKIDAKISNHFNLVTNNNLTFNKSSQLNKSVTNNIQNRFARFDNETALSYSEKNLLLQLKLNAIFIRQEKNSQQQFSFVDILCRKSIKKIDLGIEVNNLLNTKRYQILSVESNVSSLSIFQLRGLMFTGKLTFNF